MKLLPSMLFLLALCTSAVPQVARIVTAAEANGTYRYRRNEIKILALGHNKLRIKLDIIYEYNTYYGPMAIVGEASEDATFENDTAVFNQTDTKKCTYTLKYYRCNTLNDTDE